MPPVIKVPPQAIEARLPALLRASDTWIGHRAKKPVMVPAGRRAARTNDPKTWAPFEQAKRFYDKTYADHTAGIGFVFQRKQGVVFVDFDHCLGEDGEVLPWAEPVLAPFRGKTFIERSVSGTGLHVLALGSIERAYPGLVPPGADKAKKEHIDVYNDLRFVAITGDLFDGAPATLAPLQGLVDAMLDGLGARSGAEEGDKSPAHDELSPQQLEVRLEEVRSALQSLDPDMPYEEWLRIGMAVHHGLGARGLELWDEWSKGGSKYVAGEPAERWASFRKAGVTLGTLFHAAGETGWRSPLDTPERQFEPVPEEEVAGAGDPDSITFSEGHFREWVEAGYQMWKPNPKQEVLVPCFNEANLHRFFTSHEDWSARLRFNIRTQYPEIDGEEVDAYKSYRALAQSHAFLGWTKRAYGVKTVQAVVQTVAEANTYDPVADWLRTLTWDGQRRVETLVPDLGVEDTPITRRCLTRWLIGAVARALRPGCKMNNMLILSGPQGRYKSSLLERLATRAAWFHESHIELKSKEGYVTLDRKWIVEFAELDGLRKVDVDKVKAFISESTSNYRSPYARTSEDHPRRFVLAGTVNEDKMLRDPTGSRRFWVIRCPATLNLKLLSPEYVAQLWAEARTMFENGVRWWDEENEIDELLERNEQFYSESAADVMIAKVVDEEFQVHGALRMRALISRLLELHIIQASTNENAVAAVLRRLHWFPHSIKVDNTVHRFWFPASTPAGKRRDAAVIILSEWRKSAGVFEPIADESVTEG